VLAPALFGFYDRRVDGVGLTLADGYTPEAAKRLSTRATKCSREWPRGSDRDIISAAE